MPKFIKITKEVHLKDGTTIPKGTGMDFIGPADKPYDASTGYFEWNGRKLKLRYRNLFKAPSMATLERWDNAGIYDSVFGARVEPDGYGPDGEPSWAMALGIL